MMTAFAAPLAAAPRRAAAAKRPPPPTCAYSRAPYTSPILPLTPLLRSKYTYSPYSPAYSPAYVPALSPGLSGGGSPPRWRGGGGDGDGDGGGGGGGGASGAVAAVVGAWKKYNELLADAPLRTKMATAMVLNVLADMMAQGIGGGVRSDGWDVQRLARFAVFGALLAGPAGHFWFGGLDFLVRAGGLRGAMMKTTADQLMFSPFLLGSFFGVMALMEGKSRGVARKEVEGKLPSTLLTSWKIWPFLNMVNFGLVPAPMRVLFVNGISVFWMSFLSVVNGAAKPAVQS